MTTHTLIAFDDWVNEASTARTGDPLWTVRAYRLGLYAIACHSFDRQTNQRLGHAAALDQVTRAIGSISANIAEGYSRSTPLDRVRFYTYALGSTREAIGWYETLRPELGSATDHRQGILIQIRRLLLTTIKRSRPQGADFNLRDFSATSPAANLDPP